MMAKAPSRRSARAASAPHPDAAPLTLASAFEAAVAHENAMFEATRGAKTFEDDLPYTEAGDAVGKIVGLIAGMQAKTLAGLRVKVRAANWCHGWEWNGIGEGDGSDSTDVRLADGIVGDLIVMMQNGEVA
jgi:hypothetical protein